MDSPSWPTSHLLEGGQRGPVSYPASLPLPRGWSASSESLVGIDWNQWSASIGTGGRLGLESACKLGIANLLDDAIRTLGVRLEECGRLPALPYMLKRGSLPKRYGAKECAALIPVAMGMSAIPPAQAEWVDRLAPIPAIDPGEAQIFATAAPNALVVLSGDKRAIVALKEMPTFVTTLGGRIVTLESVLLALAERMNIEEIRRRVAPLLGIDQAILVCFSPGNRDPILALRSYQESLAAAACPLRLWSPIR